MVFYSVRRNRYFSRICSTPSLYQTFPLGFCLRNCGKPLQERCADRDGDCRGRYQGKLPHFSPGMYALNIAEHLFHSQPFQSTPSRAEGLSASHGLVKSFGLASCCRRQKDSSSVPSPGLCVIQQQIPCKLGAQKGELFRIAQRLMTRAE